MKDVQVKVFDKQTYPTHSDQAEHQYKGQLTMKGEDLYITYKDTEAGVTTVIKAASKEISVTRMGAMKGKLKFDKSAPYKTLYATPYGELPIEIRTSQNDFYLLEKGVKLYIEYEIWMQDEKASNNVFMVVAN